MSEHDPKLPPTEQEPLAEARPANPLEPQPAPFDPLRSTTRLVVGGIEIGLEEFIQRLREWEELSTAQPTGSSDIPQLLTDGSQPEMTIMQSESEADLLRYALLGFIFETQERARAGLGLFGRAGRLAGRLLSPFVRPVANSRLASPVRRRFDRLVQRGESEIERWVSLGRDEEVRSRAMAGLAFQDTVDDYIGYLADNPEVQDLVQTQSTGLATEVIEEVRERTVSADTLIEGLVRSIMRRVPRVYLPAPPPEVRESAVSLRKPKKAGSDDEQKPPRPAAD